MMEQPNSSRGELEQRDSSPVPASAKRWLLRSLAAILAVVIAMETYPRAWPGGNWMKSYLTPITNRLGLWQGEWPLFAPNPTLNNAWISAELRGPDGTYAMWNSPYWATESGWEKFRNFRKVNYTNRLPFREILAGQDLADHLLKHEFKLDLRAVESPEDDEKLANEQSVEDVVAEASLIKPSSKAGVWRMDLYYNKLNLSLPAEGGFPSRDEATWISTSKKLLTREYLP